MAWPHYWIDFTQLPVGQLPAGWKEYGVTGYATVEDHATYGRHLELRPYASSTLSNAIWWKSVGQHAWNTTILIKFVAEGSEGPRLLSDFKSDTGEAYRAYLDASSGNLVLAQATSGGTWNQLATAAVGYDGIGTWWLELKREVGDGYLAAKAWKDGDPEPSSYQLSNVAILSNHYGFVGLELPSSNIVRILWLGIHATGGSPSTDPPLDTVRVYYGQGDTPYTATDGRVFEGDKYYGPWTSNYKNTTLAIAGTDDDTIYQGEKWLQSGYDRLWLPVAVPLPDAAYRVTLHFAEIFHGVKNSNGVGTRVFDIDVGDGQAVISNFDILAEVPPATALIKVFENIQSQSGVVTIALNRGPSDNPKISAIEVEPQPVDNPVDAALQFASPVVAGQADEVRDASAALQIVSPVTSGQVGAPTADTSVALQFVAATTAGQANEVQDASAALQFTTATVAGQANEIRDTSAALQFTAAAATGQANEARDTSATLQLGSPQASGAVGNFVSTSAALQLASPQTSGHTTTLNDISGALQLTAATTAGQASEIRDATAALTLGAAQVTGSTGEVRQASAALRLSAAQVAGDTQQITAASATLRFGEPAIDANVGGQVASAALQLAPARVNGRSQLYPSVYGDVKTGALALSAEAESIAISVGRARVGALAFAAHGTPVRSAAGGPAVAALQLQAGLALAVEVTEASARCGALWLSARADLLQQLSHADVFLEEALVASVEVRDAMDVAVDLLD